MDEQSYKNPTAITLVSRIIKKQNIELINQLCDSMKVSDNIREELLNEFIKINYYCPHTILDSNKELLQKFFVNKYK
jgi:hypothetical protein